MTLLDKQGRDRTAHAEHDCCRAFADQGWCPAGRRVRPLLLKTAAVLTAGGPALSDAVQAPDAARRQREQHGAAVVPVHVRQQPAPGELLPCLGRALLRAQLLGAVPLRPRPRRHLCASARRPAWALAGGEVKVNASQAVLVLSCSGAQSVLWHPTEHDPSKLHQTWGHVHLYKRWKTRNQARQQTHGAAAAHPQRRCLTQTFLLLER